MTTSLLRFDPASPVQQALWKAPRARTLVEMIDAPASIAPDAVAYALAHHGADPEAVTWEALWTGARARAALFLDRGIGRGDRVLLMLPTSRAFLDSFFGVLLAGGIPVPVAAPPSMKLEKLGAHIESLQRIVLDCQASAVVGLTKTIELLSEPLRVADPALIMFDAGAPAPDASGGSFHTPRPEETALLQYTSGSTSDPKGVELTHANIIANTSAIIAASVHEGSSGVAWLPLYHDMGLIGTLLTALCCRRPSVFMPPLAFVKRPAVWLRAIG
jgi:acyl-CoA synthetase (AMP-forming)/AMP-acid ligase II